MIITLEIDRMGMTRRERRRGRSSGVRNQPPTRPVQPNVVANEKLDDANEAGILHLRLLELSSYISDMIGFFPTNTTVA